MTDSTITTQPQDDNICPSCGETLALVNIQTYDAKYDLKPRITVECTNHACNLFGTTGTINDLREHHRNNVVIYRRDKGNEKQP